MSTVTLLRLVASAIILGIPAWMWVRATRNEAPRRFSNAAIDLTVYAAFMIPCLWLGSWWVWGFLLVAWVPYQVGLYVGSSRTWKLKEEITFEVVGDVLSQELARRSNAPMN